MASALDTPVHLHPEYHDFRTQLRSGFICMLSDPNLPMPREVSLVCKHRTIVLTFTDTKVVARRNRLDELHPAATSRGGSPDIRYGVVLCQLDTSPTIQLYVATGEQQKRLVDILVALRSTKPRTVGNKMKAAVFKSKTQPILEPVVKEEFVSCDEIQSYLFNMANSLATAGECDDLEEILIEADSFPLVGMDPSLRMTRSQTLALFEYLFFEEDMPLNDDDVIWDTDMDFPSFYESFRMLCFHDVWNLVEDESFSSIFTDEPSVQFASPKLIENFLSHTQKEPPAAIEHILSSISRKMPFSRSDIGDTFELSVCGMMNYLASPENSLANPTCAAPTKMLDSFNNYYIASSYFHYRSFQHLTQAISESRCFCFHIQLVLNNLVLRLMDNDCLLSEVLLNLSTLAFTKSDYPVLCVFFCSDPSSVRDELVALCRQHLGERNLWQDEISNPEAAKKCFLLGLLSNDNDPSLWSSDVADKPFCLNEPRRPAPISWGSGPEVRISIEKPESLRPESPHGRRPESPPRGKFKKGILGAGKQMKSWGKKIRQPSLDTGRGDDSPQSNGMSASESSMTGASKDHNYQPAFCGFAKIEVECHNVDKLAKARDTFIYISIATENRNGTLTDIDSNSRYKSHVVRKKRDPQYNFRCSFDFPSNLQKDLNSIFVRFVLMQDNSNLMMSSKQRLGEAVCAVEVLTRRSGEVLCFPIVPVEKDKKATVQVVDCPVLSATMSLSGADPDKVEGMHRAEPILSPRPQCFDSRHSPDRRRLLFEGSHSACDVDGSSADDPAGLVKCQGVLTSRRVDFPAVSSTAHPKLFEGRHQSADSRYFVLNDHIILQGVTTASSSKNWSDESSKLVLSFPICMRNAPLNIQNPTSHWLHGVNLVSACPGLSPEMDDLHRGWFRSNGSIGYVPKLDLQHLRLQKPQNLRFTALGGRALQGRICIKVELLADTTVSAQTEFARSRFGCYRWDTLIKLTVAKPAATMLSISVLRQSDLQPEVVGRFVTPLRICRTGVRWLELGKWSGILVKIAL